MRSIKRFPVAFATALFVLSSLAAVPVAAASPPIAVDDGTALAPFQFFPEDAPATAVDVIANDTGPDGLTSTGLTITGKTDGAHGTVAIDAGMQFVTYTPNAEDSGTDSFTYTVSDGSTTATATVYVSINALNDAPSFTHGPNQTVAEDAGPQTVTGFVTGSVGPSIESAQKLNYVVDLNSNPGLFSVQPAFSPADTLTEDLTYTPAANANGSATITLHAVDNGPNGGGDVNFSPSQQFTITVTPANDAPVAVDDNATVLEEAGATTVDVRANDTDVDHDTLTITAKTNGTKGTVAIVAGTSVTYTPNLNAVGSDSFTYTISDGHGGTDIGTVNVTITGVNDAPTFAVPSGTTAAEDAGARTVPAFATGMSAGPADEAGQVLSFTISNSQPALFAVQPSVNVTTGTLTYTPAVNRNGVATVTLVLHDNGDVLNGGVNATSHTFTITVTPVDDAPVAVADGPFLVKQGSSVTRSAAAGVLANDTDIDTSHGLLTAVLATNPSHGSVTLNADGSFTYTPLLAYVGPDSFTYHAHDGSLDSGNVTVSLTVYVNHAPVAVDDPATVVAGSPLTPIDVLTNDNAANPDIGETVLITSATHPGHGTVVITGGGTGLSYRPASGFKGSDSFTYTISDGLASATATVHVTVPKDTFKPVATAPVQTIPGQRIGTKTVVVRLTWTGTDVGSGIGKYEIWQSVNGHKYTKIKTTTGHALSVTTKVGATYRFRVRAIDRKGNIGAFAVGPSFKVVRYQETAASYSSPWVARNGTVYSGGHERYTKTAGLAASFTRIGRTLSWVAVRGPARSTADVYVDGVFRAHVSLAASKTAYRAVAYSVTFATSAGHTLRIVYTGPTNRRIDVDAFIVLK